jgi:hypothetical protein
MAYATQSSTAHRLVCLRGQSGMHVNLFLSKPTARPRTNTNIAITNIKVEYLVYTFHAHIRELCLAMAPQLCV